MVLPALACVVLGCVLAALWIIDEPRFSKEEGTMRFAIFECPGGTDKAPNGDRFDTAYLLSAFTDHNPGQHVGVDMKVVAEVVKFRDADFDGLVELVSAKFDAYVSRVDPGQYDDCSEDVYMEFLDALIHRGIVPFNTPTDMMRMGSKASLFKLQGTPLSLNGTNLYTSREQFLSNFPLLLKSERNRVLKRNRGSKGEGVWWIHVEDDGPSSEEIEVKQMPLPFGTYAGLEDIQHGDMTISAVEACDPTHTVYKSNFRDFVSKVVYEYLPTSGNENDALLDMEFLPRIREGEIRLILAGSKVVSVVNKQPAQVVTSSQSVKKSDDGGEVTHFSTNADAGAKHVWETPSKWSHVVGPFESHLPELLARMDVKEPPILWTVDFIRHGAAGSRNDTLVISEINASCVGFAANPEFAKTISKRCVMETYHVLMDRYKRRQQERSKYFGRGIW